MANIGLFHGQHHVRRHADGEPPFLVVAAQPDFERLDVARGATYIALRRNASIDAAVEDDAVQLLAGRQPDWNVIADAHAIYVGLFHVGSYPQIVGIDKRHDRLAGVDYLARPRSADVDDAIDRRFDFGIGEADIRFGLLSGGSGLRVLVRLDLASPHGDLLAVGSRERDGRALRVRLPFQCINLGLVRFELRPRLVEILRGRDTLARQILLPLEVQPGRFEISGGR